MPTWTNCAGLTRRDCLQLGLGALVGGGLAHAFRLRASAAEPTVSAGLPRSKSCILIWQDGGPTHYETFDPKPDAPAEIRGQFKPIATKVSGIQYSEHLKRQIGRASCRESGKSIEWSAA